MEDKAKERRWSDALCIALANTLLDSVCLAGHHVCTRRRESLAAKDVPLCKCNC